MNKELFWNIIDSTTKANSLSEQAEQLELKLNELDKKSLVEFYNIYEDYEIKAYNWPLWAAAYVILGGCSDDDFMDFRAWLIMRGKKVFENTVENPDSLADYEISYLLESEDAEELGFIVPDVYEKRFGGDLYDDEDISDADYPDEPTGEPWNEDDDDLQKIVPNLFDKFKDFDDDYSITDEDYEE